MFTVILERTTYYYNECLVFGCFILPFEYCSIRHHYFHWPLREQ